MKPTKIKEEYKRLESLNTELIKALESLTEYPDIDKYVGAIIFNDCLSVIAKAKE